VAQVARQFEPFEIVFRGAGAFPDLEHPKVLWIGIEEGSQDLKQLQSALDAALKSQLGYPLETRPFHPHLTVGRVKRPMPGGQARLAQLLAEQAQFDADLTVVDEVVTFASFLSRQGPTHEPLCRSELGQR
jgi:2'-5' RNA ligase